jgi:glycosyltransferase involved in cell wall biosynthesis
MERKKIIIVSHNLRIGGAERSLLGLLNSLDYSKYDVDLFLLIHDGELMPLIPNKVQLLPENKKYAAMLSSVKCMLKSGNIDILFRKIIAHVKAGIYCRKNRLKPANMVYALYLQKYVLPSLPLISDKQYDLAISFLTPHHIAAAKAKSKKRIAWIHTDYAYFEFDRNAELAMWNKYDYIASISESCTASFLKQFPLLSNKMVLIENILHPDFVRAQAEITDVSREMPRAADSIILCSVGRFADAKNFDNVPFICKQLRDAGYDVKWYLIGYGNDEALIRTKINEAGMQEHVIILGKKENPYPYIKACDIYVQPSRYEGKAVTVREAQILCKPVVITRYATSGSQLNDSVDGIIVPMDNEGCAEGIKQLIENKALQKQLIENCRNSDFGNQKEVEKIYNIIE